MFHYISIDGYVDLIVKRNPALRRWELKNSLKTALAAKNSGAVCYVCGQAIWAAGSALCGSWMCFTCLTGEWDCSEDYEVF